MIQGLWSLASRVDRGRSLAEDLYHLLTTATGIPLAATLIAAKLPYLRQLLPLVFLEFPRIDGVPRRPRETPRTVTADKGYDCQAARALLTAAGIEP